MSTITRSSGVALLCTLLNLAHADVPAVSEYEVKAAIVYKLTKFVNWPDAVFSGPDDPLSICIERDSPLLPAMGVVDGRTAHGRTVEVHTLEAGESARSRCHVLVVNAVSNADQSQGLAAVLAVADAPVLTIGEGDAFVTGGGIIGLRLDQNRVRFVVNVAASNRAGLGISASLLQLATIVRSEGA